MISIFDFIDDPEIKFESDSHDLDLNDEMRNVFLNDLIGIQDTISINEDDSNIDYVDLEYWKDSIEDVMFYIRIQIGGLYFLNLWD